MHVYCVHTRIYVCMYVYPCVYARVASVYGYTCVYYVCVLIPLPLSV